MNNDFCTFISTCVKAGQECNSKFADGCVHYQERQQLCPIMEKISKERVLLNEKPLISSSLQCSMAELRSILPSDRPCSIKGICQATLLVPELHRILTKKGVKVIDLENLQKYPEIKSALTEIKADVQQIILDALSSPNSTAKPAAKKAILKTGGFSKTRNASR